MEDITPIHKIDNDLSAGMSKQGGSSSSELPTSKLVGIFIGLIVLGAITGFGISAMQSFMRSQSLTSTKKEVPKEVAGIKDKKTFKDSATGILKEGGFDGEGSHHLERPGGKSQNVYVTSSTVDLSEYVDHKITVHGETFAAEKAGWLMDVGLVEVLN